MLIIGINFARLEIAAQVEQQATDLAHTWSTGFVKNAPDLAELGKQMIYVTNEDRPGFIGAFGRLLGDADVNIATFNLGRDKAGGNAICLAEIDGQVTPDLLARVEALPQVQQAIRRRRREELNQRS